MTTIRFVSICVLAVSLSVLVAADDSPWWKTAIFYQVYPRSFKDSDGDGVGDLKGIEQNADYFVELGVDAIWLSPIFKSPMADFGYDISDFMQIDPIFGTMDDFDSLVTKLKAIDVKLVLDYVPNHSSDEHEWFQKSVNKETDYEDFYVWLDPSGYDPQNASKPLPPNNWISAFSGSAWEWNDQRQQFYLHKFVIKQPDLNYRNPNVVSNMTAVIDFWLDKGVDGFRMDAVQHIFETKSFPNAPVISGDGTHYDDLDPIYELNQPETFTLLKSWADVVYKYVQADGRPRAIFLEVYDTIPETVKYYGEGTENLEFPFNFQILSSGNESTRPNDLKQIIDGWMTAMPAGDVANWVIGNHDNHRIADRYGPEMVDALNLLTGVLPGIKVTYNGEEIGMEDTFIRWDQTVDPSGLLLGPDNYLEGSRDPERTPMQWDDTPSAGFSSNETTWLPVNPNYWWLNVAAQRSAPRSHLKVFQAMAQARKDPVLQLGDYNVIVPNNDTLVVVRSYESSYFVPIVNMGSEIYTYNSNNFFSPNDLDMDYSIVTGSINTEDRSDYSLSQGSLNVNLLPKGALLLRSPPVEVPTAAPATVSTTVKATTAKSSANGFTLSLMSLFLLIAVNFL